VQIRDTGYSLGDMPVAEAVQLTQAATSKIRPGEALVFECHRVAIFGRLPAGHAQGGSR
jgi:hypothetical protein